MFILIAEPIREIALLIKEVIDSLGHTSMLATSCEDVNDLIFFIRFDLILLSAHLSGIGLQQIAEDSSYNGVKIILMSTQKESVIIPHDHFLPAPFTIEALEKLLPS